MSPSLPRHSDGTPSVGASTMTPPPYLGALLAALAPMGWAGAVIVVLT